MRELSTGTACHQKVLGSSHNATKPSKMPVVSPAKAAPSIPRVVLLEPKLSCQKAFRFLEEPVKVSVAAVDGYPQGLTVIQGKHTHEAAGIDMVAVISYDEGEGLPGCKGDKVLYVLTCMKANIELSHFYPPNAVQNSFYRV